MVAATTFAASAAALFSSVVMAQQFVMYTPGGDDTAVERVDPILYPGKISQHVHQVFGNGAMNPSSNYDQLQDTDCTTVADASDHGNAEDNSVYWHPALYMEASDNSGYIRVPTNGHKMYYKNAGSKQDKKADPFEFPKGFQMLAGNPFIRAADTTDKSRQNITQWICHDSSGTNQGTDGGFPTGVKNCDSVDGLNGALHFPHCWNGNDFSLADPTAHMAYPDDNIQDGKCPDSHPTRLPHIFMENTFNIDKVWDKVKPDSFVLAMGDPTGYGWHADFLNGWVAGALPELFDTCPQPKYGNEDIASCPSFKKRSVKASDCKLKTTFTDNVDTPGQFLPGCNPVTRTNPAPLLAVVAMDISTNTCNVVSGLVADGEAALPNNDDTSSSPVSVSSSTAAASYSAQSSSAAAPATYSAPSSSAAAAATTFATAASSSSSSAAPASSSSAAAAPNSYAPTGSAKCPDADGTTFTAANGKVFEIECGTDHVEGNLAMVYANSLSDCIAACASHDGCVDVSMSGAACYMKKTLGASVKRGGVNGAKLVTGGSSSVAVAAAYVAPTTTSSASVKTITSAVATSTSVDAQGDWDVVWVTEVVTVTAGGPEMQARQEPAAHAHHQHAKYHVGRRVI